MAQDKIKLPQQDTIAAIATPPGKGGIGIIRISGNKTQQIAKNILGFVPKPREASLVKFKNNDGEIVDEGVALFFPNPNSFTGEDVLELQGHGGPIVQQRLLQTLLEQEARLANPGEFSLRAFLNDKIDLTQAEAIADLIDAHSIAAAKSALRSLQGEFSNKINQLNERFINLRMMVEAAIDFPEEEIDFLSEQKVQDQVEQLSCEIDLLIKTATQGVLLREGISVVIAGKPNAGKSSLLNCLSGRDSAIVTDIPGTTRDVLREYIHIDGLPLHIIDTAGLRDAQDVVEQEGMRRAWQEIEKADLLLLMMDAQELGNNDPRQIHADIFSRFRSIPILVIKNKIDLIAEKPEVIKKGDFTQIQLSAKYQLGIELLKNHIKNFAGFNVTVDSPFIARRRHREALVQTQKYLLQGQQQLARHRAGELLAEDLRMAQQSLNEITGEFTSDDLLGRIFSSFCIGK